MEDFHCTHPLPITATAVVFAGWLFAANTLSLVALMKWCMCLTLKDAQRWALSVNMMVRTATKICSYGVAITKRIVLIYVGCSYYFTQRTY